METNLGGSRMCGFWTKHARHEMDINKGHKREQITGAEMIKVPVDDNNNNKKKSSHKICKHRLLNKMVSNLFANISSALDCN